MEIKVSVDPSDYSVGIMSDTFHAYEDSPRHKFWVELEEFSDAYADCKFVWWNDDQLAKDYDLPRNSHLVERTLHAFVKVFYGHG